MMKFMTGKKVFVVEIMSDHVSTWERTIKQHGCCQKSMFKF